MDSFHVLPAQGVLDVVVQRAVAQGVLGLCQGGLGFGTEHSVHDQPLVLLEDPQGAVECLVEV